MIELTEKYALLSKQLSALLAGERSVITNLSQFSAFVFNALDDLNWAGFYLSVNDSILQLGPFQGQVACTKIPIGKGVCGTVAESRKSLFVKDVNQFAGHIACDSNSLSELVCPLIVNTKLIAVFDIDSPKLNRFDQDDQNGIENFIQILVDNTDWFSKPDFLNQL